MDRTNNNEKEHFHRRLNPYSNGMWIELAKDYETLGRLRLNPYSNGMWIEPATISTPKGILSLNPYSNGMWIEPDCNRSV